LEKESPNGAQKQFGMLDAVQSFSRKTLWDRAIFPDQQGSGENFEGRSWRRERTWDPTFSRRHECADFRGSTRAAPLARSPAKNAEAVIPSSPSRSGKYSLDANLYAQRHLVECCISKLKQFRCVATRFEKTARNLDLLKKCATSTQSAYVANDSSAIIAVFEEIGKSIGGSRITQ
jgi:hypothetical protein